MCIFIQEIKANQAASTEPEVPLNDMSFNIKPLNLQGGQCTWCGKYGHKRPSCPLLK
ncbi:hypothetical protein FB192DRAFT_1398315 [Mucor lusitanicus]|uniref:CCHC-type domain-containing protein n=1 Tax=Mucor circinelloides f. lusitanicus TaxID=29924 RepID=A0A8H4BAQ5_MUCCL|nr:hypothetical protein FB192DRAFT_1398315 [Mucor lusitanicus]